MEPTLNELACPTVKKYLIIDGMEAVQALMHATKFRVCEDLGNAFPTFVDKFLHGYKGG